MQVQHKLNYKSLCFLFPHRFGDDGAWYGRKEWEQFEAGDATPKPATPRMSGRKGRGKDAAFVRPLTEEERDLLRKKHDDFQLAQDEYDDAVDDKPDTVGVTYDRNRSCLRFSGIVWILLFVCANALVFYLPVGVGFVVGDARERDHDHQEFCARSGRQECMSFRRKSDTTMCRCFERNGVVQWRDLEVMIFFFALSSSGAPDAPVPAHRRLVYVPAADEQVWAILRQGRAVLERALHPRTRLRRGSESGDLQGVSRTEKWVACGR